MISRERRALNIAPSVRSRFRTSARLPGKTRDRHRRIGQRDADSSGRVLTLPYA